MLFVCIFESRSRYKDQPIGWFSPSHSILWQVSLATGRLTLVCIYITSPFTESFDWLGRRMILLQRSRSGHRTQVTQPKLTLFLAPYPLDQRSFLQWKQRTNLYQCGGKLRIDRKKRFSQFRECLSLVRNQPYLESLLFQPFTCITVALSFN